MCSCVPCEVLRQCSTTNPADIIIYVPSMTVLGLRKIPFYIYFMPVLTLLFVRLCVYYTSKRYIVGARLTGRTQL